MIFTFLTLCPLIDIIYSRKFIRNKKPKAKSLMKHLLLPVIFSILLITSAQAQHMGHSSCSTSGTSSSGNTSSSNIVFGRLSVKQGTRNCGYVGIKGVNEFIATKNLSCLRNSREIRSQKLKDAYKHSFSNSKLMAFEFSLSAGQTVPRVSSGARGVCTATANHKTRSLRMVCVHDVARPMMIHVHMGERGVKGPMICANEGRSPAAIDCSLSASDFKALEDGELYINLHSEDFPDGEIRGQINMP